VPAALTKLDTARHEDSHRWPQFLPDGRHFLYLARTLDMMNTEIQIGSIDAAEPVHLLSAAGNLVYASPGWLLFPRGNILMAQPFDPDHYRVSGEPLTIADQVTWNGNVSYSAYSVSSNSLLAYTSTDGEPISALLWMDRSGKPLGKVGDPGRYFGPSLSPDGRKLAVEILDSSAATNSDIWIYDLAQSSSTRLTFSQANEHSRMPVWSPDGSRIVFSSVREGRTPIYEKAASGLVAEHVVFPAQGDR
jgi:Tol biopolymer transport system component